MKALTCSVITHFECQSFSAQVARSEKLHSKAEAVEVTIQGSLISPNFFWGPDSYMAQKEIHQHQYPQAHLFI